jgi:predicted Zn-dependent protease with MMP-like domain
VRDDRHGRHRRADVDRRRRPVDGFRTVDASRFVRVVEDVLRDLPDELLDHLADVAVAVEDVPPADADDEVELGRYVAAPAGRAGRTGRDRLTLYRRPIEARATSKPDLAELVRLTVVHEVAHHLGIDDDRLDDLGW